jgi:hypothetical protein
MKLHYMVVFALRIAGVALFFWGIWDDPKGLHAVAAVVGTYLYGLRS